MLALINVAVDFLEHERAEVKMSPLMLLDDWHGKLRAFLLGERLGQRLARFFKVRLTWKRMSL